MTFRRCVSAKNLHGHTVITFSDKWQARRHTGSLHDKHWEKDVSWDGHRQGEGVIPVVARMTRCLCIYGCWDRRCLAQYTWDHTEVNVVYILYNFRGTTGRSGFIISYQHGWCLQGWDRSKYIMLLFKDRKSIHADFHPPIHACFPLIFFVLGYSRHPSL